MPIVEEPPPPTSTEKAMKLRRQVQGSIAVERYRYLTNLCYHGHEVSLKYRVRQVTIC